MASELYEMLNLSYLDFVEKLAEAFGTCKKEPIPALVVEFQVTSRLISQDVRTDRIYKKIHEGFKTVIDAVYERDVRIFKKKKTRIALFDCTHLYEVFPRMQKHEHGFLWECLQSLAQPLCTLSGSSKYIDSMTDIAQEFLRKNPNADETNARELLFSQMLSDSSLMEKTAQIFEKSDISSMRTDFAEVLRGFGLTADTTKMQKSEKSVDESDEPKIVEINDEEAEAIEQKKKQEEDEDEEDDEDEGDEGDEKDDDVEAKKNAAVNFHISPQEAAVADFSSMEAMFADMAIKDAGITTKTEKRRRKKGKNPLKNMIAFMENKPLDEAQLQEMKDIAKKTLSSDAKSEDREKMQKMFAMFGNKNTTADTLVKEFTESCKDENDPEAKQFLEMFAQMKQGTSMTSLFDKFSPHK